MDDGTPEAVSEDREDARRGPARRLRRRERKLLRQLQIAVPVALVIAAGLLSMGVVRVMEVPKPLPAETPRPVKRELAPQIPPTARVSKPPLQLPIVRPDIPDALGVSLLDHEVQGPPEENRPEPELTEEDENEIELELLPSVNAGPPMQLRPVPEPGTFMLLAPGLVGIAAARRNSRGAL